MTNYFTTKLSNLDDINEEIIKEAKKDGWVIVIADYTSTDIDVLKFHGAIEINIDAVFSNAYEPSYFNYNNAEYEINLTDTRLSIKRKYENFYSIKYYNFQLKKGNYLSRQHLLFNVKELS